MADQQQPGGGEQQPAQPLWPTAYGQAATFKFQHIPPPSAEYFSLNDRLVVRIFNPFLVGATLFISGRILRMDGQIVPFRYQYDNIPQVSGPQDYSVQIGEGFLLDVSVANGAGQDHEGDLFVIILRTVGQGNTQTDINTLASGYVRQYAPLGWPPGIQRRPGDGFGKPTELDVLNPPPGQDVYYTSQYKFNYRVGSIYTILATSATVANRVVSFIASLFNVAFKSTSTVAQPASTVYEYVGIAGLGSPYTSTAGNTTRVFLPLPANMYLTGSWSLGTNTDNLQPGDQFQVLRIMATVWSDLF